MLLGVVVVAGAASLGVAAHPDHPPLDGCPDGRIVTRGAWTSIAGPSFPDSSSRRITDHAVALGAPAHLLVTNGTSVLASSDGGCEWRLAFQAPTVPSITGAVQLGKPPARFSIGGLQLPGPTAYLTLLGTDSSDRDTSRVMVSGDFGETWRDGSAGLPPFGHVRWLAAAPSSPGTAYALVDDAGLFATADGGRSWSLRQADDPQQTGYEHLVVDPLDPLDLWAWKGMQLYRSRDGGGSWARSVGSAVANEVLWVDVAHAPGGASRVLVVYRGERAARSDDGGATFRPVQLPPGVIGAASALGQPDRILVMSETRIYGAVPGTGAWQDITPPSALRFARPRGTATARPFVFVGSENGLERTALDQLATVDRDLRLPPLRLSPPQPARLDPPGSEVRIDPGGEVTVARSLTVPFRRGPLDVYFLVDTTNSMGPLMDGLSTGITAITSALQGARIDARFGVGELKDYPLPPFGRRSDRPYRRVRDLGPADDSLQAALDGLEEGGGEDEPESQLAALFQTATGAGQVGIVDPGQQASFRPQARRIVILGTDAPFHRSDADPTYPGPPFAATMAALRERGIAVVGLALDDDARADLQQVAVATGAVASIDLDCTGDGIRDLLAGQPLVCPLDADAENVAAAVVATLNGVEDIGEIRVAASAAGDVVRRIGPTSSGPVNLRIDQRFDFSVTYGCRADQAGQRIPVALQSTAKGAAVLAATDTVVCATASSPAAAAAATPPTPPAPPPEPAAANASAPPPAPAPPPAAAAQLPVPHPQVQVQIAPQVQPQLQVGVATQEQKQVQLARAGIDGPAVGPDDDDGTLEVLAFAGSALALTGAATVAARRIRTRSRPQPAYVRSNRPRGDHP